MRARPSTEGVDACCVQHGTVALAQCLVALGKLEMPWVVSQCSLPGGQLREICLTPAPMRINGECNMRAFGTNRYCRCAVPAWARA